jgi:hypothetical protein
MFERADVFRASIAAKLRAADLADLAERIEACGQAETALRCTNCGNVRWVTDRCNTRWCPTCSRRIAARRAEELRTWAKGLRQPKHVVLTVRNSHIFNRAYVQAFKRSLAKLRRHRWRPPWLAGSWTLEVTNEGRGYHLHAHMLVEARWIDAGQLATRWADLVHQEFAIVKVLDARKHDYAAEVAKYIAKPAEVAGWAAVDLGRIVRALDGSRVFGVFGSLFKRRAEFARIVRDNRRPAAACECGCNRWTWCDPIEAETGIRLNR